MDEKKRKILEDLGGIKEEVYDSLVNEFIADARNNMKELEKAINENDQVVSARIAHTIKGASGNLRLYSIQEASRSLEKNIKEGAPGEAVKKAFNLLCDSLVNFNAA